MAFATCCWTATRPWRRVSVSPINFSRARSIPSRWPSRSSPSSGGRPRDVVGTLDYLVDYVAQSRDWRVARVHTARELNADVQHELVDSLHAITGKDVELQIADEPSLLGGVLVEIGDLRLDASTKGRLGALHDAVASGRDLESALQRNN